MQIEALALTIEAMNDAENAKRAMLRIEAIAEVAKQDAENSKEDEAAAEES